MILLFQASLFSFKIINLLSFVFIVFFQSFNLILILLPFLAATALFFSQNSILSLLAKDNEDPNPSCDTYG